MIQRSKTKDGSGVAEGLVRNYEALQRRKGKKYMGKVP